MMGVSKGHKDWTVQTFSDEGFNSNLDLTYVQKFVSLLFVSFNGCWGKQVTCLKFFVNSINLFYGFNKVIGLEDLSVDPWRPVDFTSGHLGDVPIS